MPAVGAREPRPAKEGAEGGPAGFPAFPPACLGTGMGEARITHVSFPNLDYVLGKSPAFLSVALVLSRTFNAVGMWLRPEGIRDLGAGPYCHERTGVSGESSCFSALVFSPAPLPSLQHHGGLWENPGVFTDGVNGKGRVGPAPSFTHFLSLSSFPKNQLGLSRYRRVLGPRHCPPGSLSRTGPPPHASPRLPRLLTPPTPPTPAHTSALLRPRACLCLVVSILGSGTSFSLFSQFLRPHGLLTVRGTL